MMYGWDWGVGGGVLMMLLMVLFFAAIIVGIVLIIRSATGHGSAASSHAPSAPSTPSSTAMQVLEERYARGDINREEFMQRKQDLLGKS